MIVLNAVEVLKQHLDAPALFCQVYKDQMEGGGNDFVFWGDNVYTLSLGGVNLNPISGRPNCLCCDNCCIALCERLFKSIE